MGNTLGKRTSVQVGSALVVGVGLAYLSFTAFGQSSPSPDLRDLFEQYRAVSSLHFVASVEVTMSATAAACCQYIPPGITIKGSMEFWAEGGNYRVNSYMEPDKYPGMDTQIAYNGEKFQMLRLSANTLSYSSQDQPGGVMSLPNPLLELIQFRYPVTDANAHLSQRFKDVTGDHVPPSFWNSAWTSVEEDLRMMDRVEYPGGRYEGRDYVHHVFAMPGARNLPVRIDRVTASGARITSSEFSQFEKIAAGNLATYWPQIAVLRAFEENGKEAGRMSFILKHLEVNAEFAPEVFTIDTDGVRVWDDELEEFVQ